MAPGGGMGGKKDVGFIKIMEKSDLGEQGESLSKKIYICLPLISLFQKIFLVSQFSQNHKSSTSNPLSPPF